MDAPSAIDILRELVADLPDEAEDEALAALATLTEPAAAAAALVEQDLVLRLAAARPRLISGVVEIVEDDSGGRRLEGSTDCPDCTRGTRSVGGVLVCITLPARVGTLDGTEGDLVACGKER